MKRTIISFIIGAVVLCAVTLQAQESTSQFGELLIELETSVFFSVQSDEWRARRNGWIADIRSAGDNLPALKRFLVEFETHLNFNAASPLWRNRRAGWLQSVKNARSLRELAQQMVVCETSISYSAQAQAWRSRRPVWISRARNL